MINHNEWLVVGLITSPHGIDGKLKIKSFSDFEERFTKPGKRWIEKEKILSEFELTSGFKKPGKDSFIISLEGINSRDKAANLKGCKIFVKATDIPKLKKNEFHLSELINLKVKIFENEELKIIGEVLNLENEPNHLLVIKLFTNNKEVLVPFVKEIIPLVDIENKFLIIKPPSGLLEL